MEEIWKEIPGYVGLYEVSNLGKVRSLDRYVNSRWDKDKLIKGQILKPKLDKGYLMLGLRSIGNKKFIKVHQLVAMAFLGHIPDGFNNVINHIDFNKLNNNVNNLEITNQRRNTILSIDKTKTSSKYIGVQWNKQRGRWKMRISIGKDRFSYLFTDELKASEYYNLALNLKDFYDGDTKKFKDLLDHEYSKSL